MRALAAVWLCAGPALFGCYHVAQLARLVRAPGAGDAPALFLERCSSCHGEAGRGDGSAGRSLDPRPRDFSDSVWQAAVTDDRIRLVIQRGGGAAGLSTSMAAHADLTDAQLDTLVSYIRGLGRGAGE